jgi:hypothetical protein
MFGKELLTHIFGAGSVLHSGNRVGGDWWVVSDKFVNPERIEEIMKLDPKLTYDDGIDEETKEEGGMFLQYREDDDSLVDICIEWSGFILVNVGVTMLEYEKLPDGTWLAI